MAPRRRIVVAGVVLSRGEMMKDLSNTLMFTCFAAGAGAVLSACHSGPSEQEKAKAEFQEAWAHRTPTENAAHPTSVVVAQGPSPLVYQVQEPCTVRIVDMTTGAEIATAAAKKLGMVYVSEETGAFVNGDRVVPGPFNRGHRYSISIELPHEEKWGSSVRTQPPATAASQPSGR